MSEESTEVPGLRRLRRTVEPSSDLWPGIKGRLKPRHRRRALPGWAGLALAASLLAAIVVPLHQHGLSPAVPGDGAGVRGDYFLAQFRVLDGAQQELLLALQHRPQSPALRRLLESTRQRQRDLRRLALANA